MNLVISMFGGVPCYIFYAASLLVAPISVGPQIIRMLTLRGAFQYSALVVEDEISSRQEQKRQPLPTIPSGSEAAAGEAGSLPPSMMMEATSDIMIEANNIMDKTKWIVKLSKWALLVIPTLAIICSLALSSDTTQLTSADFDECQQEPTSFQYTSQAFGIVFTILAFAVSITVAQVDDELHIANEIQRNSNLLGLTYIIIVIVRLLGYYEWQPLLQTIQQMCLSFSMGIIPFLSSGGAKSSLSSVASLAKQRINPATRSAQPGFGRPLPKERASTRASIQTIIGGGTGARQSVAAMQQNRQREQTVSWDAGLAILLSADEGNNLFSQHCAREFSSENVRFWSAVNDYKSKFDEENCIPPIHESSTDVDDDSTAPPTDHAAQTPPTANNNDEQQQVYVKLVAHGIYNTFISIQGSSQVNLSSKQRSDIKAAIDSGRLVRETFDVAQKEIFSVMSRDSYPRFLQSKKSRVVT